MVKMTLTASSFMQTIRTKRRRQLGLIYPYGRVSKGWVPILNNFPIVLEYSRGICGGCDEIVGALFYGSVQNGTFTQRSDLDLIAMYQKKDRAIALAALGQISEFGMNHSVIVEPEPICIEAALASKHSIGITFREHLRKAALNNGVVKENPLDFLMYEGIRAEDELRSYFCHKMRQLDRAEIAPDPTDPKFLEAVRKMIEAPVHSARKTLHWLGAVPENDCKREVVSCYNKLIGGLNSELLIQLVEADQKYTDVLWQQTMVKKDKPSYLAAIDDLWKVRSLSAEFVFRNAMLISETPYAGSTI